MKKVLLATSALVVSAGMASAQGVGVSGSASMGLLFGDWIGGDAEFHTDIDITFTMSGETDNGLTFGASIDLDESDGNPSGAFGNRTQGGETIFISGAFGTLTMGDTDGALDWALTETAIGGSLGDAHTVHGGYTGNGFADGYAPFGGPRDKDGQIARYDYSFGDFAFAISIEIDDDDIVDPTFGIGGRYTGSFSGWTLGIGIAYQDYFFDEAWGVSLDAQFDQGFRGILNYVDMGDTDRGGVGEEYISLGVGYSMDAWLFSVNYGNFEEGGNSQDGFGIAVNYDLGGGAEVQFGYSDTSCGTSPVYVGCSDGDAVSFGVSMSF